METKNMRKFLVGVIHILVWVIVFCIPLFVWQEGFSSFDWDQYLRYLPVPLFFMLVFYLNYFVLVEKLLFRKKIWPYIFINLALIAVCTVLLHLWQEYNLEQEILAVRSASPDPETGLSPGPRPPGLKPGMGPGKMRSMPMFFLRDGMMLLLTAGLALAVRMTMQWFQTAREKHELEIAHTEAELRNLKNQLNPHFLFNTLNNIYALIESNPEKARYGVESLSRLLRHVLYDTNQNYIPLEQELAFVRSYVELMSLRLPTATKLTVDIPEGGYGIRIAPLLFISLIENAFKHGISHKKESFIDIRITLNDRKRIVCTVENSYVPRHHQRPDSGIGIVNLEKRLLLLYPGRYRFVTESDDQVYRTMLSIDL